MKEFIVPVHEDAKDYAELFVGNVRQQSELIRCKDCAWHTKKHCANFGLIGFDDNDYCSYAERKKK